MNSKNGGRHSPSSTSDTAGVPACPGGCTFVSRGLQSAHQCFQFHGPTYLNLNSFAEPGNYSVSTYYEGNAANVFGGTLPRAHTMSPTPYGYSGKGPVTPASVNSSPIYPFGIYPRVSPTVSSIGQTPSQVNPTTAIGTGTTPIRSKETNIMQGNPGHPNEEGNGGKNVASGIPRFNSRF